MRLLPGRLLSRVGLMALPILAACGKGEATKPQATEFNVVMVPAAITLKQAETGLVNAAVTISAGPGTDFTFTVEGVPAGVAMAPPAAAITAPSLGSINATMAVVVGTTAAPGTYTITTRAKSKAGVERTATLSLTVVLPPSFTIAVTPTAQSVTQSGNGGALVSIARTNFTGAVLLSIEDNPPGVTGTFTPPSVTGNSAALAIVVGPTVTLNTYTLTVRAQSPGLVDRTATFALTVTAEPSFSLRIGPTALSITTGTSAVDSVLITRINYTDGIAFAFDSPVAGITGSFNPGATTGASTVLTVAVAANVAAGTYATTIRATGPGVGERTVALPVTVALPAPAYVIAATPAALTVQGGQSGTSAIAIARTNFAGAVALALDAPPAGITGSFVPPSTTTNASQLALAVAANVAPGVYTLTVKGTATGLTDRTTTIALTVTAPPQTIALAALPESLFVFQGGQAATTVSLTRNNFAGSVTFAASGGATGITVTFGSSPTTGNATTMNAAVAGTVAAGRYVVTVTATGTGVAPAVVTVPINVTAAGSGSLQFTFCDPARKPVFFAYQDSTGAWTPVSAISAGTVTKYFFNLVSDRGGVAFVTRRTVTTPRVAGTLSLRRNRLLQAQVLLQKRDALAVTSSRLPAFARAVSAAGIADVYDTFVYFLAKTEMNTVGLDQCTAVADTKTNLATVAGVGTGQLATVSLGGVSQSYVGGVTTSPVTFTGVPTRTVDLVGTRTSLSNGFEKGLILRNLNAANGATLATPVDFNGANAFVPVVAQATINNGLAQQLLLNSIFLTANGEAGLFGADAAPSTASARIWAGVPASKFMSTDLHGLFAIATPVSAGPNDFRSVLQYEGPVSNTTVTLGAEMDLIGVLPVGAFGDPRYRVSAQTLPVGLRNAVEVFMSQTTATGNSHRMLATGAYLTNSGVLAGFDLTMPPLAALTGFPVASRLTAGSNELRAAALGWTGTSITTPRAVLGDQLRIAARGATVLVP